MHRIKKFINYSISYLLLLMFVGAISYLLQFKKMGFYWDDWQAVLLYKITDPNAISTYFSFDRPFSAWTYTFFFSWLPIKPWVWQILTTMIRGIAIFLLVEAFLLLWPTRKWLFRWVGLLIYVAPTFYSQSISVAFNQHFLTLFIFSLSLLFTGLTIKYQKFLWVFLPLATVTTLGHLMTMEYFSGLEAIRLLYIYYLVSRREKNRWIVLRNTFLFCSPFILIDTGFVYWRFVVYPSSFEGILRNDPAVLKQLMSDPGRNIVYLITRMTKDMIYLLVNSWGKTISLEDINFLAKANVISWIAGGFTAVSIILFLSQVESSKSSENNPKQFYRRALILSVGAIIFGGLPVWMIGSQITEGKWSDRFSLAPMIGTVLLIVLIIDIIIRTKNQKNIILAILLGLSIAFQIRRVNRFRLDWDIQRNFYWQLSWRIPDLQTGTAVISPNIPTGMIADYSVSFALNVLYENQNLSENVPYWFFTPRDLSKDFYDSSQIVEIDKKIRSIQFSGSNDKAVALFYKSSARCLKVLDQIYQDDPYLKTINPAFFNLNNENRILSTDGLPPSDVFGQEPTHGWCYYFQKADLARQKKQWQEVIFLMDEAFAKNFHPATGSELLPLLDAYLHVGNWDGAVNTANQMITITSDIKPAICSLLSKSDENATAKIPTPTYNNMLLVAECK